MKWILFCSLLLICNCIILCQNIVFPDDYDKLSANKDKTTITERLSESTPENCPKNMALYPLEGTNFSVCDCFPRFLYFDSNDSCYEAYKQGPCPPKYYFTLPLGESTAKCVENPCLQDGLVKFNNTCYPILTKGGPCDPNVIGINETTFQLECISTVMVPHIISAPLILKPCYPPGTRRTKKGFCKKPVPI
ncbi:hypothetical protein M0802_012049 [Mischocyttarus mexicanus]|nr:hypothetical protein M0802_012049 [Mischocyttarus mexicanus]